MIRDDAKIIIDETIKSVMPENAVKRALAEIDLKCNRLFLLAIGKAAWSMASAASEVLGDRIDKGIVITKYGHVKGDLLNISSYEAGHPISDENTYLASEKAIEMVKDLSEKDKVLFLISGGGSALFEKPLSTKEKIEDINKQLLASGANIKEINTIRKRLSAVKGGKFASLCYPAKIEAIILSDIIGDPIDMIASGPAYPDSSTCQDAFDIVEKYSLKIDSEIEDLLKIETPKEISNVSTRVTGSVRQLCSEAAKLAKSLGYKTMILTDSLDCQAKEAGLFLGAIASYYKDQGPLAIIAGGETVVELKGKGLGGRNQEFALSAAEKIAGFENICIFSAGSDGTDGPTDAAGGIVDGTTKASLEEKGIKIHQVLSENDSYHALSQVDGLVITGPTGTNVNDFALALIG